MKAAGAAEALARTVAGGQSNAAVRYQAVRALAAIGGAPAASALRRLVIDVKADTTLRIAAIGALGSLPGQDLDLLLDLTSDAAPPIRAAAMEALAQVDPGGFLTILSGLDPDPEWTVRAAQAAALGALAEGQGSPRLMTMLQDRDQRVVTAVLGALIASRAPEIERILLERLKAEDFGMRAFVARALSQIKSKTALPALVEVFRGQAPDSTYVARAAALEAMAAIDPVTARPVLQEALADREWPIRLRAAGLLKEAGVTDPPPEPARPAPETRTMTSAEWSTVIAPQYAPHAFIETSRGAIEIELAISDAPLTVNNFVTLARKGFFNDLVIHRAVPDFVAQFGDPRGDGEGGPGYTIRDELNERPYLRGTVGMALDWEDTGGSQFFITVSPQPHLDGRYTVFGHVVNGMDTVDQLRVGDVVRRVRIWDGVTFE
jgi:cyclophilin family peptidyl-prolyl cis-trans isomerase